MQARAIGKRRVSECVVRMPSPDDAFAAPLMLRVAQCLGLQAEAERHERAVQARLDQQEQALAELREQLERTTTQQAALILQLREDVQRLAEAQHQHAVATEDVVLAFFFLFLGVWLQQLLDHLARQIKAIPR